MLSPPPLLIVMATRYYTTQKGDDHWAVLGDPSMLTKEEVLQGKELRATMTKRDWALQQVCVQLEVYGDYTKAPTMEEMIQQGKYNWTSWVENDTELPTPTEQMYYQYYHMEELINELVEKGFVAAVGK